MSYNLQKQNQQAFYSFHTAEYEHYVIAVETRALCHYRVPVSHTHNHAQNQQTPFTSFYLELLCNV